MPSPADGSQLALEFVKGRGLLQPRTEIGAFDRMGPQSIEFMAAIDWPILRLMNVAFAATLRIVSGNRGSLSVTSVHPATIIIDFPHWKLTCRFERFAAGRQVHRRILGMCTVHGKTVFMPRHRTDDPAANMPGCRPSLTNQIQDNSTNKSRLMGDTDAVLESHRKSVDHYRTAGDFWRGVRPADGYFDGN